MPMQQTFDDQLAGRIRAVMAQQKPRITQEELGRRLGWGQTSVSKRLSGRTKISASEITEIARALDCSLEELGFSLTTASGRGVRS